ncbi:MAG: hypothetical protein AAF614_42140 [Chloroflexota bacterium]
MFSSPHSMQMVVKQEQRELVESVERKRQHGLLRNSSKNRPFKRFATWLKSR